MMKTLLLPFTVLLMSALQLSGQTIPNAGYGPGGIGGFNKGEGHQWIVCWLKADDTASLNIDADDKEVQLWRDISGNGNHATAEHAGETNSDLSESTPLNNEGKYSHKIPNPPFYIEAGENHHKPWINFGDADTNGCLVIEDNYDWGDGSDPMLDSTDELAVIVVFKRNILDSNYQQIIEKRFEQSDHIPNRAWVLQFDGGEGNPGEIQFVFHGGENCPRLYSEAQFFDSLPHISMANFNKQFEGITLFSDAKWRYTKDAYVPFKDAGTGEVLEVENSPALTAISRSGSMDIAEIIVMRDALSLTEAHIVNSYLGAKYNITLQDRNWFSNESGYTENLIAIGKLTGDYTDVQSAKGNGIIMQVADPTTLNAEEMVFATHYDTAFTEDANKSWCNPYYIQAEGTMDVHLFFDFKKHGFNVPADASGYSLYKSNHETGAWDTVASSNGTLVDTTIVFTVPGLKTGYYTIGTDIPSCTAPSYSLENSYEEISADKNAGIDIYPVPAKEQLSVSLSDNFVGEINIDICNTSGRVLSRKTIHKSVGKITQSLNIADLQAGVYILKVSDMQQQSFVKFIKE